MLNYMDNARVYLQSSNITRVSVSYKLVHSSALKITSCSTEIEKSIKGHNCVIRATKFPHWWISLKVTCELYAINHGIGASAKVDKNFPCSQKYFS